MMIPKALAQLRRDLTLAQQHLAFLERCAASGPALTSRGRFYSPRPTCLRWRRRRLQNWSVYWPRIRHSSRCSTCRRAKEHTGDHPG